jgi:hypothetical protein
MTSIGVSGATISIICLSICGVASRLVAALSNALSKDLMARCIWR